SLASTALLWLGAWSAWRFRDRPRVAGALVLLCFFAAVGFKEYAFAMAPLSALVMLWFSPRRPWLDAIAMGLAVSIAILAILVIRQYAVPLTAITNRGFEYILLTPRQVATNFAILATGSLFFGNSIWVFVHESASVLAIVALALLIAASVITLGLRLRIRA